MAEFKEGDIVWLMDPVVGEDWVHFWGQWLVVLDSDIPNANGDYLIWCEDMEGNLVDGMYARRFAHV